MTHGGLENVISHLNIDVGWKLGLTPPVKLEADLTLVEEDRGCGHHSQDAVKAVISSHLRCKRVKCQRKSNNVLTFKRNLCLKAVVTKANMLFDA